MEAHDDVETPSQDALSHLVRQSFDTHLVSYLPLGIW